LNDSCPKPRVTAYPIAPVPKPRMTRRDRFDPKPAVQRYWAFKNECRLRKLHVPCAGAEIHFVVPMPKSWSTKKRAQMLGWKKETVPDLDNYLKAVGDAVYDDDSAIWHFNGLSKTWGEAGAIIVIEHPPPELPLGALALVGK